MGLLLRTLYVWLALTLLLVVTSEIATVLDYQSTLVVATDFEGTIWQPARNVLDGVSPYPSMSSPDFVPLAVYPPSAFLPALPLGALPVDVAATIFRAALLVAAFLVLWVLGVRDWRCHALWLSSPLVVIPVLIGNATLLVVLCAALLWRYRDVTWAAAAALVSAIAIKLFLAPLCLWLVFTGRWRAAVYAAAAAPIVVIGSWAFIRFDGLLAYPGLMRELADRWSGDGALVYGLGSQLGLGGATSVVAVTAGVALLAAAWFVREREIVSFTLVSTAAIVLSPIGWTFYVGVLVVPLAIRYRHYSPAWTLLSLFWIVSWWHTPLVYGSPELSVTTIAVTSLLVIAIWRQPRTALNVRPVIAA